MEVFGVGYFKTINVKPAKFAPNPFNDNISDSALIVGTSKMGFTDNL